MRARRRGSIQMTKYNLMYIDPKDTVKLPNIATNRLVFSFRMVRFTKEENFSTYLLGTPPRPSENGRLELFRFKKKRANKRN